MATVPNPRTWLSTEAVTDAKLNADNRDAVNFYVNKPMAILTSNAASLHVSASSATAIPLNFEALDRDNGHSNVTNNTRYTAQTAGLYHILGQFMIAGAFQWADLWFRKNGTTNQNRYTLPNNLNWVEMSGFMSLAVNDYVEVVFQPLIAEGEVQNVTLFVEWIST